MKESKENTACLGSYCHLFADRETNECSVDHIVFNAVYTLSFKSDKKLRWCTK